MLWHLNRTFRLVLNLVAFAGIFVAPWWVPTFCMIALSLRFSAWEVPFIGLMLDLVWLPWGSHLPLPIFTLAGIALVWAALPLRRQLLL